ncbi:hypothetical protein MAR_018143 [Mya arenaria]|uniref:Uncharacterized protein n=1 Tax=Mya arenaria TaxID=6604 RepID=A0ABY7EGF4_MYAAR|nr:hypothetical protein MAR_018143 [Mya arenaria]
MAVVSPRKEKGVRQGSKARCVEIISIVTQPMMNIVPRLPTTYRLLPKIVDLVNMMRKEGEMMDGEYNTSRLQFPVTKEQQGVNAY